MTVKGGKRPNSGRKKREKAFTNYQKALRLLDDSIEEALSVVIKGLRDEDKAHRLKCAELLIKKALPDKQKIDLDQDSTIKVEFIIKDIAS